ncbi:MAG: glycosyltransferase [Clostridiales bacterium]|nr:glycosyltransferase [Clostridiales bacterium]
MNKKISILMGIYNCESTLAEAIDCILAQTYANWELILCDDGSKDKTVEVAQSYVQKYPQKIILLKNEKNMGLNYTLNKCLEKARGEYIARMDGDDTCNPLRFEKEINFLEENPEYALVSCQMELFDKDGVFRVIEHKDQPVLKDFLKRSQFCHAGCMMRTKVIKELGGYTVSDKFLRVEDYELWVRMYLAGYIGYNLQEVLYSMRDDRSASKRRTFKNRLNESRVIKKVCKEGKFPIWKYVYALVPILKWLTPRFVYNILHKNK